VLEQEAAMESLVSRPYAGTSDLQAVLDLVLACRAMEDIDPWPPFCELRQHLCADSYELSTTTRVWERCAGGLAAVAAIWDGEALISYIHPRELCDELAAQILAWGLARADIALLGTTSWNVAAQHLFASEDFRILHHVRWYAWTAES
jgi:hypothetical protein